MDSSVHSRSQRFNESGAAGDLSRLSQSLLNPIGDTSLLIGLSRRERIMQNQGKSIAQELSILSREMGKGITIYERSIISEHVRALFGYESEKLITNNSSQIITQSPIGRQGYFTNGALIEEILLDFLNENSMKFTQFKLIDNSKGQRDHKKTDFLVECENQVTGKIVRLSVIFYIADCHNSEDKLTGLIERAQIYKTVGRGVIPAKVHEEIFEIYRRPIERKRKVEINIQNVEEEGSHASEPAIDTEREQIDAQILRYCVLYELKTKQQSSSQLIPLQKLTDQWQKLDDIELVSPEKVAYYFVQILEMIDKLQRKSVYSYVETNLDTLTVDTSSQLLYLNSDMQRSFKLHPMTIKQDQPGGNDETQLDWLKEGYVELSLFRHAEEKDFTLERLIISKQGFNYSNRLLIGLLLQQIFNKCEHMIVNKSLESSDPKAQLTNKLQNMIEQFKEPPMLSEAADEEQDFNYCQIARELIISLYQTEGIQELMKALMRERKFKAVVKIYERVIDSIENDQAEFGGIHANPMNKYRILLMVGKSLRQIGQAQRGIEVLNQCNEWSMIHYGKKSEYGIECLLQLAKTYGILITSVKDNATNQMYIEKAFDYAQQAKQMNSTLKGDYNQNSVRVLHAQYLFFIRKGDIEGAFRYIEQKLRLQIELFDGSKTGLSMAKTQEKLGDLHYQVKSYKQAQSLFEKVQSTYQVEFSDGNPRNLDLSKKLGRVMIKNQEYRNALRGLQYLVIQHELMHGKNNPHLDLYEDHKLLGICFQSIGDLSTALHQFEQSLKICKQLFIGIQRLEGSSEVSSHRGSRIRDSDSVYGSIDKEFSEYSTINYRLGTVLLGLKKSERAYECFQIALKAVFASDKAKEQVNEDYAAKIQLKFGIVCLSLGKKEKARMNFEYCLQHYTQKPLEKITSKIYLTIKQLFTNLIEIKSQQGALPAAIESAKHQISLYRKISQLKQSTDIDEDLVSAIRELISLYQDHLDSKGTISEKAKQVVYKKMKDLEAEQLLILEKDIQNNKGTFIETCISLGHLCVKLDLPKDAVINLQKAKDTFDQLADKSQKGSHQHFKIIQLLAEACLMINETKRALVVYEEAISQRDGIFKESFLSFTIIEKFDFHKQMGDLYDKVGGRELESASYLEEAIQIAQKHPELDLAIYIEVEILNKLVYNLNMTKSYEKAIYYNKELHKINAAVDPIHPNALNSCITQIRLIDKSHKSGSYHAYKEELCIELLTILEKNAEKYIDYDLQYRDEQSTDDFSLLQGYLLAASTIDFLSHLFGDYLPNQDAFQMLSAPSIDSLNQLHQLIKEIRQGIQDAAKLKLEMAASIKKSATMAVLGKSFGNSIAKKTIVQTLNKGKKKKKQQIAEQ
ncbi:hypothetical protein FGO68_gene727 [Halteria grandinella]|uniref:Uncharacterized protein n=1 Tax=Halteria grandinella TaxID=5974 RepID=A0A8J8P5N4_HALGN|nr:hypothetical protein FGO68_gene727 [Halteria grandinella]